MKTIKQIADEIGVSKQAVYKRVKGALHTTIAPYVHTVDGILYISDEGKTLVIQAFAENDTYKGAHTDAHTVDSEIIKLLQDNIAILQDQLVVKDKQLEEKDKQLAELTIAVRLNAEGVSADRKNELAETIIDGKRQLMDGSVEQSESTAPAKRFWERIFGRKS